MQAPHPRVDFKGIIIFSSYYLGALADATRDALYNSLLRKCVS
jgi:hypothetical protein